VDVKELYKKHKLWLKLAYNITNNYTTSQDLVADMYLKLLETKKKYDNLELIVYKTLYRLHIDNIRKKKILTVSLTNEINEMPEPCDEILSKRNEVNNALNNLHLVHREALIGSQEKSLRKFAKEINVPYYTIFRLKNEALEILKKQLNG